MSGYQMNVGGRKTDHGYTCRPNSGLQGPTDNATFDIYNLFVL